MTPQPNLAAMRRKVLAEIQHEDDAQHIRLDYIKALNWVLANVLTSRRLELLEQRKRVDAARLSLNTEIDEMVLTPPRPAKSRRKKGEA